MWRRRENRPEPAGREQRQVIHEIAGEFTTEELQEFLEADLHPVQADPAFKEALRLQLWELVQQRRREEQRED